MPSLSLLHVSHATDTLFKSPQAVSADPVFQKRSPGNKQKQNALPVHGKNGPSPKQNTFPVTAGSTMIPLISNGKESEYFMKVALGSPPQEVWLEIDTGSAITWTGSSAIGAGKTSNKMLHAYEYQKSATYKHQGSQNFQTKYADNTEITGPMGQETMNMGGLVLHDELLGIGQRIGDMEKSKGNGLIGLSFGSAMVATFRRILRNPVMTFHIVKERGGELTLGTVETRHLQGELTYAPVFNDGSGHWLLDTGAIRINGQIIPRAPRSTALPDTGSTTIYLPSTIVHNIYKLIPGSFKDNGDWYVPENVRYPPVELQLGGHFYRIPSSQMTFAALKQYDNTWLGVFQESVAGFPQDTLGTIFLKSYLLVLDIGNARIGLGRRNDVIYD